MNTAFDKVSIEELLPCGFEDFMDALVPGRIVCNAPGGSDAPPPSASRDTIPCPPPDFDDIPF
jgi:hypothetical protein